MTFKTLDKPSIGAKMRFKSSLYYEYIIRFTSLCKNFAYLSFLAEAFLCHMHHNKSLAPSNDDEQGTEKSLLKAQVSKDFA